MPPALADHWIAASFLWGLLKSLIPLPSLSGFMIISAEIVRRNAGAGATAAELLLQVVLPGAAGVAVGTAPYYVWARRAGIETVSRWGPALGIKKRRIQDLERRAARRRELVVWSLFALPLSPSLLAAAAAGVLDIAPWAYGGLAFSGACARCALLAVGGWIFRNRFGEPARLLRPTDTAAAAAIAFLVLVFVVRRRHAALRPHRDDGGN